MFVRHDNGSDSNSVFAFGSELWPSYDCKKDFRGFNQLSVYHFLRGDNDKAIEYALTAIGIAKKNDLKEQEAIAESNIALVYSKVGDYEKANEYNFMALKSFQEQGNLFHVSRCILGIGSVYYLLHDYEKAVVYFSKADSLFVELNDNKGHGICLTNIGSIYNETGKSEKAISFFIKADSICDNDNDDEGKASNYANMGSAYLNMEDYVLAKHYYNKSIALASGINNYSLLSRNYLQMSKVFSSLNQNDTAYDYCIRSLDLVAQTGEMDAKIEALRQLSVICYKCKKYKEAYDSSHEASLLRDSMLYVEKSARIALLEEKFHKETLEKQNLELGFQNEIQNMRIRNQKQHLTGFAIVSVVLALLCVLILVLYKKKNTAYKWIVKKNLDLIHAEQKLRDLNSDMSYRGNGEDNPCVPKDQHDRIIRFIETEFIDKKIFTEHDLTLEKLAKYCNTNRTYLSKIINETYHMNYSEFINGYRINEAVLLLSDPVISRKFSIEAIANEAGYSNISSFNAVFKKNTGLTPSAFRKNLTFG